MDHARKKCKPTPAPPAGRRRGPAVARNAWSPGETARSGGYGPLGATFPRFGHRAAHLRVEPRDGGHVGPEAERGHLPRASKPGPSVRLCQQTPHAKGWCGRSLGGAFASGLHNWRASETARTRGGLWAEVRPLAAPSRVSGSVGALLLSIRRVAASKLVKVPIAALRIRTRRLGCP